MQKRQTLWCGPGWRPSGQQPPSMLPATLPYIAPSRPSVSAPVGQSWERFWSCGGWRALDPARQHDKTSQASEPWSPPPPLRRTTKDWPAGGGKRQQAAVEGSVAGGRRAARRGQ